MLKIYVSTHYYYYCYFNINRHTMPGLDPILSAALYAYLGVPSLPCYWLLLRMCTICMVLHIVLSAVLYPHVVCLTFFSFS